jgi:hypothetical protein
MQVTAKLRFWSRPFWQQHIHISVSQSLLALTLIFQCSHEFKFRNLSLNAAQMLNFFPLLQGQTVHCHHSTLTSQTSTFTRRTSGHSYDTYCSLNTTHFSLLYSPSSRFSSIIFGSITWRCWITRQCQVKVAPSSVRRLLHANCTSWHTAEHLLVIWMRNWCG